MTPHRPCRRCGALFADPGPGKRDAPAGYCTPECYKASRPVREPRAVSGPRRTQATRKRQAVSPAHPEQRAAIKERACVVCRGYVGSCHPAHLIDRSLTTVGQDDPRAVVPLCPEHHRRYDEPGDDDPLDLLPYIEPHFRAELAFAVERVGLVTALRRITNDRALGGPVLRVA